MGAKDAIERLISADRAKHLLVGLVRVPSPQTDLFEADISLSMAVSVSGSVSASGFAPASDPSHHACRRWRSEGAAPASSSVSTSTSVSVSVSAPARLPPNGQNVIAIPNAPSGTSYA